VASGLAIAAGQPTPATPQSASGLRLTMMDVGQGESLLIESGGWRGLIDAGGRPFGDGADVGRRVVVPALWARGVTSLDALLITHPDPDHVGGAGAVVDSLPVRELWWGVRVPGHEPSEELLSRVAAGRMGVSERWAGERLRPGNARVRVLHPPPPDWERRRVRNDDSVVLEIVQGDVAMLLLGDVSAEVERAIVPHLAPARIRILKAGHHGSRTSTSQALVEAWRPDIALISCGRGNSFGHPAPAVLARLRASGASVFRTDMDGQITVRSDGRQAWVETFRGRRAWVRSA
jgi:competence protein ComEC